MPRAFTAGMVNRHAYLCLFAGLLLAAACESAPSSAPGNDKATAAKAVAAAPPPAAKPAGAVPAKGEPATPQGLSGRHRAEGENDDWEPSEYKKGMARFRDTFVYADGQAVGVLDFAELPLPLEPVWIESEGMMPYNAKRGGPKTRSIYERRYRFRDYFKALGLPLGRIKEVHLYGGSKRKRAAAVVPGRALRQHADNFLFRFGAHVSGKAIPTCPEVGWNCPDLLTMVAVYIDKPAPKREDNVMTLEGEPIYDVPYLGEPLRGGIRISLDNRYVARIKRRLLDNEELREVRADGSVHWDFLGFLREQGVETKDVQEAWLVHKGELVRRLDAGELSIATFTASPQGKGEVLLGWEDTPTNAVLLYTKPLKPGDLPVIMPHERFED